MPITPAFRWNARPALQGDFASVRDLNMLGKRVEDVLNRGDFQQRLAYMASDFGFLPGASARANYAAAVDMCEFLEDVGGGILFIPRGTYSCIGDSAITGVNGAIPLKSNTTLWLEPGCVLQLVTEDVDDSAMLIRIEGQSDCEVWAWGATLRGDATNSSAGVDGVYGLLINGGARNRVRGGTYELFRSDGIVIAATQALGHAEDYVVEDVYCNHNLRNNIADVGSRRGRIINARCEYGGARPNGTSGGFSPQDNIDIEVYVDGAFESVVEDLEIIDPQCRFALGHNIELRGDGGGGSLYRVRRCKVVGGAAIDAAGDGVHALAVRDLEVVGLTADDNGGDGMQFGSCDDRLWVERCRMRNNGGWGVNRTGSSGGGYVLHNVITDNTAGRVNAIAGDHIRGNFGFVTENGVESSTFAIDSTGDKTVTIAHGCNYVPSVKDLSVVLTSVTNADVEIAHIRFSSADATNVVFVVRVQTASATGGATAKLAVQITRSALT